MRNRVGKAGAGGGGDAKRQNDSHDERCLSLPLTLHLDIIRSDVRASRATDALLAEGAQGRSVDRVGGCAANGD